MYMHASESGSDVKISAAEKAVRFGGRQTLMSKTHLTTTASMEAVSSVLQKGALVTLVDDSVRDGQEECTKSFIPIVNRFTSNR